MLKKTEFKFKFEKQTKGTAVYTPVDDECPLRTKSQYIDKSAFEEADEYPEFLIFTVRELKPGE